MELIARSIDRRFGVRHQTISGSVADRECITRGAAFRTREMANDRKAQDEMNREGKTCRGGNPSPQVSSMSTRLQHPNVPPAFLLALRSAELKTTCRSL